MARDYSKCVVLKDKSGEPTGQIVLPKGKMLYGSLLEKKLMKGEKDESKAKYGVTILLPKEADLKPIVDLVAATANENFGEKIVKTSKIKKPFLKVNTDESPKVVARLEAAGIDAADFPVMIRLFGNFKPVVLGPDAKTEIRDEEQIYDGRWACVSVNAYGYDHPTGGKGVSLGLNNVQLLDNDDPIPRGGGSLSGGEFEAAESAGNLFD